MKKFLVCCCCRNMSSFMLTLFLCFLSSHHFCVNSRHLTLNKDNQRTKRILRNSSQVHINSWDGVPKVQTTNHNLSKRHKLQAKSVQETEFSGTLSSLPEPYRIFFLKLPKILAFLVFQKPILALISAN